MATRIVNAGASLTDTSLTTVYTCPANYKSIIKELWLTNIDGTSAADVTIKMDDGSASRAIASTISVPADSSLSLIGKDNGFYLDETDLLAVTASANSDLTYLASYELMKDA